MEIIPVSDTDSQFLFVPLSYQFNSKNMKRLTALLMSVMVAAGIQAQIAGEELATGINDPLQGKVVNVLGDSYVRNHRRPFEEAWHYQVAALHGMKYNNYGRNGGCVAFDRSSEGFGPSLLVRYKEMDAEADLVLIIAGHNDAGIVGNSKEKLALFADSLDLLLNKVKEQCPKARIAWVTPWWVDRDGFKPVVRMIKKVCKRHRVPVLDNYKKSCVVKVRDAAFRKQYFQGADDTAHLNKEGHQLFLPVGDAFVKKVMNCQ